MHVYGIPHVILQQYYKLVISLLKAAKIAPAV